jgi:F0F1-type ATP synthase assembly protein I
MAADRSTGRGVTPPPGDAWNALSFLLSGFLLFGGIGWGLDELFGTRWFTPVGLLAGGAASVYLIYVRYVKS